MKWRCAICGKLTEDVSQLCERCTNAKMWIEENYPELIENSDSFYLTNMFTKIEEYIVEHANEVTDTNNSVVDDGIDTIYKVYGKTIHLSEDKYKEIANRYFGAGNHGKQQS